MPSESVNSFILSLDWGKEMKIAESQADTRLSYFRKDECNSKGFEGHDIAMSIISKILANPEIIKDSDLNLRNFRARIQGEINNAVRLIVKSKEIITTSSFGNGEVLNDEDFFDEMLQTKFIESVEFDDKKKFTAYFEQLGESLLKKNDEDAWLILEELRDGTKPKDISNKNNIPISKIYSAIKRIHRAGKLIENPILSI